MGFTWIATHVTALPDPTPRASFRSPEDLRGKGSGDRNNPGAHRRMALAAWASRAVRWTAMSFRSPESMARVARSNAPPDRTAWWQWPTVLSLDAPAVALVWQIFFARLLGVPLQTHHHVMLGMVTWVVYAADRWMEGLEIDPARVAHDPQGLLAGLPGQRGRVHAPNSSRPPPPTPRAGSGHLHPSSPRDGSGGGSGRT